MARGDVIEVRPEGLYCAAGDFFVDPWRGVDRAVITHAHSDHARFGSRNYLCGPTCEPLLRHRLGKVSTETLGWGETRRIGQATVSLYPAGHVLGSAQVRVEAKGEVWVVSGDYKRQDDASCEAFEPVRCDGFITEATFGLPIYRWDPTADVIDAIVRWHERNAAEGMNSVLYAYALGKAQRLLAGLNGRLTEPVFLHGALVGLTALYREMDIALAPTERVPTDRKAKLRGRLVLAPPSAYGSTWLRRFRPCRDAFVSGWMRVRGIRRRRGYDQGFVMSDHVDWPDLMRTIDETGASRVLTTHGETEAVARFLREARGLDAAELETAYSGEDGSSEDEAEPGPVAQSAS
ncbi:MAG: ligase-associated DNA damage response exonuclease [Opitutales bacterium]